MGLILRQESIGDDEDNLFVAEVLLEAPTLSSKEMARAREEALYVLKTKSPEEAFKIFTEGLNYKVADLPVVAVQDQQEQTQTVRPPTPPATSKGQSQITVPLRRN